MIFKNPGDVGVQRAAFLITQQWATFLGAEYQVNDDAARDWDMMFRPYRATTFVAGFPGPSDRSVT